MNLCFLGQLPVRGNRVRAVSSAVTVVSGELLLHCNMSLPISCGAAHSAENRPVRGVIMVVRTIRPDSPKKPTNSVEAGRWLRDLRRYWQITQAELAEQAGLVDPAMIEWIEAGEIRLPSYLYTAYARAFMFDPGEFADTCALYYAGKESRSAA